MKDLLCKLLKKIKNTLGLTVRQERKEALKKYLEASTETKNSFSKLHKDILLLCKN